MTAPRVCWIIAGFALGAVVARGDTLRITADGWIDPTGKLVKGPVAVEVADGYFKAAPAPIEPGSPVADKTTTYEGAILCPGLVDVSAALGALSQLTEDADSFQPDLTTRDAFDRFGPRLHRALEAGVTTFGLAPDDQNVIGGRIAVCKTFGEDGKPRVIDAYGPLKLSLSPAVFQRDRAPTSRSGALGMLTHAVDGAHHKATTAQDDDPKDALMLFSYGALQGVISAPSAADVLYALDLQSRYGLKLVIAHTMDAFETADLLGKAEATVIVGPLTWSSTEREQRAPGLLSKAGADVVVAGGLPLAPANALRIGASLASRCGLELNAARRAITIEPARALRIDDRVGSIQGGRSADFVVFSGDPLDLRSRVLAVYVDGAPAFVAPKQDVE
ncbi:MAG: amidohydrolase family protein [Phycisphaerales bacterium]|nr:amidohydrolase family protein [Phycisphaerales bacterium]